MNYEVDEKRNALQKESVNVWIKAGANGSILGHPGFGKTRIGCLAAFAVKKAKPSAVIILVSPSKAVCDQWVEESKGLITHFYSTNQVLVNYNNGVKLADGKIDLVIFDEYHKMLGEETLKAISDLRTKAKYKLGLFGIEPNGEASDLIKGTLPIIHKISETEIISNNWIKNVEEINITCPMSDSEKLQYTSSCNNMDSLMEVFTELYDRLKKVYPDVFTLIQACTRGISIVTYKDGNRLSTYHTTDETITNIQKAVGWNPRFVRGSESQVKFQEYWSAENISIRAAVYNKESRIRSNLITKVASKLDAMETLIVNLLPNQTIAYCESIEACTTMYNRLTQKVDPKYIGMIHSKMDSIQATDEDGTLLFFKTGKARMVSPAKQKDDIILRFKSGSCKVLLLVKSLSEGLNVPNLNYVINLSGSRDNVTYGQRKARSNRLDDSDKEAIVFNLVCEDVIETTDLGLDKIYVNIDAVKLKRRQEGRSVLEYDITDLKSILEWVKG